MDRSVAEECIIWSPELEVERSKALNQDWLNLKVKDYMIKQKSRCICLHDADIKYIFFHFYMKSHFRSNNLSGLNCGNTLNEDLTVIKALAKEHF